MTPKAPPTAYIASNDGATKAPRARSKFLSRYIIPSDNHEFVGRIYGLSIVAYHFDSYEALAAHADCKYACDVNFVLSMLTRRVESLNATADTLWPEPLPTDFKAFPVSRYQWLTLAADAFLMRYVSVVDCAVILVARVFETGLEARKCSIEALRKARVPAPIVDKLQAMLDDQGDLRDERNGRFHHGRERGHTDDDQTFRAASMLERYNGVTGTDRFGRKINLERSFREGLVELQRDFNQSSRKLVRQLDDLYDQLFDEFERRFVPLIRASTHGLRG